MLCWTQYRYAMFRLARGHRPNIQEEWREEGAAADGRHFIAHMYTVDVKVNFYPTGPNPPAGHVLLR